MSAEQRRHLPWHPIQERSLSFPLAALSLLELFPVEENLLSRLGFHLTEDVRMAPDQFAVDGGQNVPHGEDAGLLRHPGVKDNLEHEVAQFLPELCRLLIVDGLQNLIGFLHEV